MSNLRRGAEILKTSWCQGSFRANKPDGFNFCAIGALNQAMLESAGIDAIQYNMWKSNLRLIPEDEIKTLAKVIFEQCPDEDLAFHMANEDYSSVVVEYNDHIAKSSDEVISMFEKAAIKMEEKV